MPGDIHLELKGLKEARAKADQTVKDLHGTPFLQGMRDATMLVTYTARREAKVNTGRHRASITPEVRVEGSGDVQGVVGTALAYGPYAVLDTKPHWPPIDAIELWVHQKGLGGKEKTVTNAAGQTHTKLVKRAPASVEHSIAFLIARAISKKGTKGDESLIKGLVQNAAKIHTLLGHVVGKIVEK